MISPNPDSEVQVEKVTNTPPEAAMRREVADIAVAPEEVRNSLGLTAEDLAFHRVLFEKWGFCGCGDPDSAVEYVRDALDIMKRRSDAACNSGISDAYAHHCGELTAHLPAQTGAYWLLLYWLDHQGLTEHGGNASGSWLTDKGEALVAYLKKDTWRDAMHSGAFGYGNDADNLDLS